MTDLEKEALSIEELEQISGGMEFVDNSYFLFQQDDTRRDRANLGLAGA